MPRPYQREGIEWLSSKKRAMLIDAPGLGKTLQAAEAAVPPVLVACPTYLVEQWADFLREQYPDRKTLVAQGSAEKRVRALREAMNEGTDYLIVNIEMLRQYPMPPNFTTFIIDESHHVRGRNAKQSKAAAEVAARTERVYLLTATPIVREPDDLYMQFHILDPEHYTSYYRFLDNYCRVIGSPYGAKVVGAKNPAALRRTLAQYALGRSYQEVGLQLPDLIPNVVRLDLPPKLQKVYKETKEQYRFMNMDLQSATQVINILRQITLCSEKMEATANILQDARNNGDSAVVFTWYRDAAEALAEILECPYITGEMTPVERVKVAKAGHRVVTATLASLSEGVDLSHARVVVFFEVDYTPGIMYQALSRVRRYSQNDAPVRAYYLMMKNTIDEIIYKQVTRREHDARMIAREALRS